MHEETNTCDMSIIGVSAWVVLILKGWKMLSKHHPHLFHLNFTKALGQVWTSVTKKVTNRRVMRTWDLIRTSAIWPIWILPEMLKPRRIAMSYNNYPQYDHGYCTWCKMAFLLQFWWPSGLACVWDRSVLMAKAMPPVRAKPVDWTPMALWRSSWMTNENTRLIGGRWSSSRTWVRTWAKESLRPMRKVMM